MVLVDVVVGIESCVANVMEERRFVLLSCLRPMKQMFSSV